MTHILARLAGIALVMGCMAALAAAMVTLAPTHPWAVVVLAGVGLVLLGYAGGGIR